GQGQPGHGQPAPAGQALEALGAWGLRAPPCPRMRRRPPAIGSGTWSRGDAGRYNRSARMIQLHRVSKVYQVGPVKIPALSDVSFGIDKGEFVVLTGPSGAGKTTLLRLLYREELPSDGEVEVLGAPVTALKPSAVS